MFLLEVQQLCHPITAFKSSRQCITQTPVPTVPVRTCGFVLSSLTVTSLQARQFGVVALVSDTSVECACERLVGKRKHKRHAMTVCRMLSIDFK